MFDRDPVLEAVGSFQDELVAIRRDIHRHPEIAFEEVRTAGIVAAELRRLGIEVEEGIGRTGVVGTLRGTGAGQRAIGLRADMDCLALEEKTGLDYASSIPNRMHACGHDGHTTMLLGAARYLAANRHLFGGTVYFIFQPAEEGHGGGRVMLEEGLFRRFPPDAVYALHNKPGIAKGHFSTKPGPLLAAVDSWTVTFRGPGGHGGSGAHFSIDLSVLASTFVMGLQAIVARNVPAVEPAVLSVGHMHGGSFDAPNVLPSEMVVRGTARSFSPAVRDILESRMRALAGGIAATHGADVEIDYERRYPPLVNHAEQVEIAAGAAEGVVGEGKVARVMSLVTGAEDFSYMLEQAPGCFMYLGAGGGEDGKPFANLHTPAYDFNDDLIPLGVSYWVRLVEAELGCSAAE